MPNHGNSTALLFHPLTFLAEGDDVVVGRRDIDSYIVLPADGAALLRQLVAGRSPADAAAWYRGEYTEPVDVDEFVEAMRDLDFVQVGEAGAAEPPVRWQRLGRALFSPLAWLGYTVLFVAAITLLVTDHGLLPAKQHVFFSPYLLVIELVLFAGQAPLSLLHEWFHLLAGRRLGLHSRIGIGRRMYLVVFETAIDGLVSVPRRRRYLPMLAGMLADLLGCAALIVVAALTRHPDGTIPAGGQVCLALAYLSVLRFVWQFYFFLRTDIYHLVTTVLGCRDLHTVSTEMLRNNAYRLLGRPARLADETGWHPRDRQIARWYAPLHAVGYLIMLVVLVTAILPLGLRMLVALVHTLLDPNAGLLPTLDALGMLVLNLGPLAVAAVLYLTERRAEESR